MTTMTTVDIALVEPHPRNVRRDDTPDDELVASIEAQGILQPLGVVEHEDGYMLVAGHRRLQAARAACLTEVPIVVLEHLDTDAKVIEAMLVENGRRQDLSPVEEAAGYEQLELAGYDVAAIASATGRAESTVRERLKVARLPKPAQDAVHARQLTLQDADRLAQLEEAPDLLDEVTALIGGNDFHWKLGAALRKLEDRKQAAEIIATAKDLGLPEVEEYSWANTEWMLWNHLAFDKRQADSDTYRAPEGYTVFEDGSAAWLVRRAQQATVDSSIDEAERAAQQAAWDRQREEQKVARERIQAAQGVRLSSLRDALADVTLPGKVVDLLRVAMPIWLRAGEQEALAWLVDNGRLDAGDALTIWHMTPEQINEQIQKRTGGELIADLLEAVVGLGCECLDPEYLEHVVECDTVADYVAWLEQHGGHPVSSVDHEWIDAANEAADRLNGEDDGETDEP